MAKISLSCEFDSVAEFRDFIANPMGFVVPEMPQCGGCSEDAQESDEDEAAPVERAQAPAGTEAAEAQKRKRRTKAEMEAEKAAAETVIHVPAESIEVIQAPLQPVAMAPMGMPLSPTPPMFQAPIQPIPGMQPAPEFMQPQAPVFAMNPAPNLAPAPLQGMPAAPTGLPADLLGALNGVMPQA